MCPPSGVLKNHGCFAQASVATRRIVGRLEAAMRSEGYSYDDVVEQEAALIGGFRRKGVVPDDGLGRPRDPRLHTSGDVKTLRHVQILAAAAADWIRDGGGPVFTFSHAWQWIPAAAWHPVPVRASCEAPEQAELALRRGYAYAIVPPFFEKRAAKFQIAAGLRVTPCPEESVGTVTCTTCRICVDQLLRTVPGIAFEAHGRNAQAVRTTLVRLNTRQWR